MLMLQRAGKEINELLVMALAYQYCFWCYELDLLITQHFNNFDFHGFFGILFLSFGEIAPEQLSWHNNF